ncbi:hypothetical protein BSLG_008311 [Batrachochytrium salamandrivorans]|nr:hypothetical protein BSLG_008311 [Batrachochytrium salamandrivorans]
MGPEPLKLLRRLVRDLGHVVGARSSDLLNGGELGETAVAGQQQGSKSLASNIQAVVTTDLEPTHYALASSLIFDTKMGVIWILRAARNQRQHDDAKTILLNTLASFIPLLGESVMQCYASQTISICISMFISHEIARVKLATFGPISQILELGFDESTVGLAAKKIFDSYYMEYIQQYSKLSPSVRGAILRVLGFISRKYPGCISVQHREQLLRHLLKSISTLFAMDKSAMSIQHVGGAMNGLNQFMLQTPLSREEDILLVYKCIVFVIQPIDDLARYDLPRAGLQILIDNSYVFVPHLLKDWETLYSHLEHMSSHKNRQMSRLALTAFEQFLKHVSEMLLLNVDGSEERSCFSSIIAKLNYKLTTPDLPISDVSLAIRGFGIFASACKAFWGLHDLIDLTQAVVRRGSQFYNNANVVSEDHLLHIPSFFVSLSHICKELEHITLNLVHVIGMIADVMLLYFPNIGSFVQNACCDAFIQLLWSLHSTHHSFLNIWRQTASKALLLTSAVTIPMSGDSLLNATGRIAEQAHKEYLHFWTGIFDLRCISSIDASRNAAIEVFRNLLFDEFMRAVITFPQSLNLSTTNPSIQSISTVSSGKNHLQQDTFDPNASFGGLSRKCDPAASVYNAELAAVNPKDHQSLVCFVEFCEIFMLGEHKTRLSRWILMLSEAWARMSNRYVLVSGFYRLFALNLKLSVDLGLFDGSGGDQRYTADCQALFSSHIIQVLNRMGLFKDELLNSCLSMVLSTPTSIVSVLKLKDAMCRALTLGISYAPLAVVALNTLKRWIKRVDCDTMHQVLSHVLPHLAEYLVADTEDTLDNPIPDLHVPNKVAFSITKMRQKRLQTSHTTFPIDPEDLKQIQSMVVFILGHVGRANRLVLGHEDSEISVSWNIEMAPVLFFDVPFHKTTTRIYFDEILPRIVYLAESSPDRKTKVSAVELLYSLIIMMLGRSEFGPGSIAFTIKKFHQIFGKLFPCMLRLAVDLESVSRSLFKPLTLQLIHWLTQPTNNTDSEAAVLLTACMDAATSDCENLRDFGSECISEFLRYYLKHASDVRLNGGPESICDVIIRIHRLLIHHDSHKRAGACMIVNRIYGILCENEIMVQTFAVESLYYVLCALQLADGDEPSIGTTTLAQKTVDTVSKIILDRIALFETVDERRRSFPGLVCVDLMSLLGWLYEQFGSREVAHAQVCIKLFVQFSSIVSDAKTLFDKFATVSSSGLPMNLVPRVLFSNWKVNGYLRREWIQQLIVSIELYICLLDTQLLSAQSLSNQATIIHPLLQFVHICSKIESPSDLRTLTRMDHGCTEMVAIAMFGLLRLLKRIISEHTDIESLGTTDIYALLSEPLFQTIALSVFSPSTLGLDLGLNSGLLCNWDALLQDVLGIFHAKLTAPIRKSILLTLVSAIDPFVLQLSHLNQATSLAHHTMQLHGLKLLKDTAWMDELSNSGVLNSLHQGLLSLCVYSSESDPVILSVASELLDVCLSIPIHRSFICSDLLMLTRHDVCLEAIRFYQTFRRTIDMSFAAKLDDYYPLLEGNWTSPQARMAIMGMLDSLLDFPELYQETIVQLNQTLPWSIHLLKGIFSRGDSNDAFISRSIFSRICLVFDPRTIHSPEFTKIMSSELAYLLGTQFSLAEKHHTVQLLAPFASIDADVETQMAQLIKETIEMQFPISPRDIIVLTGTDQYTYYISFVETILHGVEQYGSAAIGECIFTHLCRDDHGIFTAQIQISMYRMGCNLSIPKVVIFMDMCMRSFQSSIIKMAVRGNIIRDVLVPILLGVDIDVLTSFFVKHIKTIMGIISSPLSMAIDPLYLDLTTKTACYRIMEIAYIRLPYAKLHHKSGEVISAYTSPFLPTDERALSLPLMKHSHAAKSEAVSVTDPDDMAPLRLRYHQAAYAVLSATICKTQSKSEVFKVFLFSENPAKGERHWENLVDLNANLSTILDFHTTEDLALSNRTHQMNSDPVSLDTIGEKDKPRLNFKLSGTSTTQESLEFGSTQIEDMHLPFSRDISSVVVASLRGEACKAPTLPGVISACAAELIRGFKKEAPFPIKVFIVKIILSHPEYFEEFKSEFWKPLAILLSDENTFVDGLSSLAQYILYQALFIPEDAPGKGQALGAVYLLSAFVSCGIPIYTGIGIETLAISEGTFLDRLVELCQNSSKDLCTATAELLGQLLELFERDRYVLLSYLVLAVRNMLKKLSQVTSELYRRDRFVLIINRISSKFPAILKEFDKSLLYILPQLFGSTKELCLKALCTYASKSVDMFVELRGRGLLGLLSDRDDECQRLTVMILSEIVLHLSVDDVMYFKDTLIAAFSTHPNEECRKAYFLLIVGIVKTNFGNNLESTTPSLSTTQSLSYMQSVDSQEHLDDHDIDTQMIDERAYASDIISCLRVCLLKGLADKCDDIRNSLAQYIEAHILGAKPILERTVQIFKLMLIFSRTRRLFLQYATRFLLDASQISANFDVDIFPSSPEEVPFYTFPNSRRTPFLVPRIPVYYDKSKKNLLGPSEKYRDSEFASLRGLKRVYVKRNAAEERDYFSAKALRLKSKIQKAEHLQKLARSRQVNLSRSYRVGEYPDMKIKPSSFLKPLWTLTQRDADISKFVLSKLVSSIMISSKKDGCSSGIIDDQQEIQYSISSDLADVISDTMRCSKLTSPAFIGSMLKILYDTSCTVIEPQLIATASIETGNENLGILLLEKSIQSLLSEDSVHQGAALLASWVSVAQMYKSIGSLDVYHAINETHLYFFKATKDAIYFSSIGEYLEAKSIFEKSLAGPIEHISAEEICVWKQGILECYSKLFQWEDLEERIISDTGNPLSSIDTKPLSLFSDQYSSLGSMSKQTKSLLLNSLQKATELRDALVQLRGQLELGNLLKGWERTLPSYTDDVDIWADLFLLRETVLDQWPVANDIDREAIRIAKNTLHGEIAKSAYEQHNFHLATVCISRMMPSDGDFHAEGILAGTNIKALPELLWIKFTIAESISLWTILKQMVEHPYDVGQLLIGNKRLLCAFDIKFSKVPTHEESLGQLINQLAFNGFKHVKSNMDEKLRRQATILIAEQCDQVLRWIEAKDPTVSVFKRDVSSAASNTGAISGNSYGLFNAAVLDKPYGDIILPLLYRVSSIFPSAVIYPLQISIPQYTFTRESTLSLGQIKGLLHSVSLPLATTFLKELRRLIEPVHIFKDWIEHTELIFNSSMSNSEIQIQLAFDEMKEYCFETHSFSCQGVKKFSKKHCKRVLEICGSDGSRLVTQKKLIWKEIKMYYARSISGKESFPLGTMPIDYYSPWLAKYRLSDHPNDTLLIPGQYEGSHQPVTGSDFVEISSFEPVVDVLGSIRRPKKLGFVGSDGKVYPFLIKGGEDLRLDQRVEHMFSTINSIILNNRQCGNSNLSIRVYGVVPMTRTLGVLEWVENTRTLRKCMSDISGFQEAFVKADKQFENFVSIYRGQAKSVGEIYGNMFMKASFEDVTAMMKSLWGTMEKPYFKMFMQNLAASPEAYVNIRSGFANSWASLSIASYLMGIGDRHTDNFLVDLKSGRVIGIDFGHAFGSATEVLPVPELVPFRLTQQIKEFVDPLGIHVMLEPPMIHVMTALREKKDMIMTALDIFVKEPLIEWQKFAISQYKRKASRTEPSTESSGMDTNTLGELKWYPQQKLEIAARKLMGEHPSHIQATELRWGHATKPYVSQACEVLLGTKNNSHRSRVGVQCESIREQVQCLIDQATDPNVLGRAWRGWVSWC